MFNFLDSKLLPKVTTKCSAMDTYEVENLISADSLVKSRGFIAYTTMKPPIDIDFQLICNVSLSYVLISTKVGSHRCSGIELFVKNANTQFTSICKTFYIEHGVIFCNSRYYNRSQPPSKIHSDFYLAFFRSNEFKSFLNVDTVRVRILGSKGTVPCLGKIEIWGSVSRTCSHDTVKTIQRLVSKNELVLTNSNETMDATNRKDFEIPDDFKDALTYDIMTIPMTLPSGHTIDQSTLEKCIATDASCGRHSCDPFTGLRYTDNRKPVVNVALKTRIDMFLLENSHKPETFALKRTLGKCSHVLKDDTMVNLLHNYADIKQRSKKIKLDCNASNFSLEDAISKAVNNRNFIRFTENSVKEETEISDNICVSCSTKDQYLYILPCKHLYCRRCSLMVEQESRCRNCDIPFTKNMLIRYHC